jgi:VanZ family protein
MAIYTKHRKIFLWSAAVFLTVAAFIFASIPSENLPNSKIEIQIDNGAIGHFLGFTLLSIVIYLAFIETIKDHPWSKLALIFSSAYILLTAFGTEAIQTQIPGREFALFDIVIDLLGSSIGLILAFFGKKN